MSNTMNIHVLDVGLGVSRSELLPDVRVQPRRRRLSKNRVENLLCSYRLKEFMSLLADDSIKQVFALNLKRTQVGLVCVCKVVEVNETKWRAQVNIFLHLLSDYEVLQTSMLHFFFWY